MKIKINDAYVNRIINNKLLLINKYEDNELYCFDDVSKLIIESIINTESKDKIINKIICEYDVPKEIVETDLNDFLLELFDANILEEIK